MKSLNLVEGFLSLSHCMDVCSSKMGHIILGQPRSTCSHLPCVRHYNIKYFIDNPQRHRASSNFSVLHNPWHQSCVSGLEPYFSLALPISFFLSMKFKIEPYINYILILYGDTLLAWDKLLS